MASKNEILNNQKFVKACEKVGIPPTSRQASKFLNKKGAAFKKIQVHPSGIVKPNPRTRTKRGFRR